MGDARVPRRVVRLDGDGCARAVVLPVARYAWCASVINYGWEESLVYGMYARFW